MNTTGLGSLTWSDVDAEEQRHVLPHKGHLDELLGRGAIVRVGPEHRVDQGLRGGHEQMEGRGTVIVCNRKLPTAACYITDIAGESLTINAPTWNMFIPEIPWIYTPYHFHLEGTAEYSRQRLEGGPHDLEHELGQADGLEGGPPGRHLVQDAAQGPDVRGIGVGSGGDHL